MITAGETNWVSTEDAGYGAPNVMYWHQRNPSKEQCTSGPFRWLNLIHRTLGNEFLICLDGRYGKRE